MFEQVFQGFRYKGGQFICLSGTAGLTWRAHYGQLLYKIEWVTLECLIFLCWRKKVPHFPWEKPSSHKITICDGILEFLFRTEYWLTYVLLSSGCNVVFRTCMLLLTADFDPYLSNKPQNSPFREGNCPTVSYVLFC